MTVTIRPLIAGVEGNQHVMQEVTDVDGLADHGIIHTRDVAGRTELFYTDDLDTDVQITSAGAISVPAHPDPHLLGPGSGAAPSYSFAADPDRGMWDNGASGLMIQAENTTFGQFQMTNTQTTLYNRGYVFQGQGQTGEVTNIVTFTATGHTPDAGQGPGGFVWEPQTWTWQGASSHSPHYEFDLRAPTLAATGAYTIAEAATLRIGGAPIAGAGPMTLTATYALIVDDGISRFDGPIYASDGAQGAPAYSFASDSDTGFYLSAGQQINVTRNNTLLASWVGDGFRVQTTGSAATPDIAHFSATGTGIYFDSGAAESFAVTISAGSNRIAQFLENAGSGNQILADDSQKVVALPTYSFAAETDSGFWRPAANQVALVTSSANRLIATDTQVQVTLSGSVGTPGLSIGVADTGFFYTSATNQQLTATVDGVAVCHFTDIDGIGGTLMLERAGTAANPALTLNFAGIELDTGLYAPGNDRFAITAGGTKHYEVDGAITGGTAHQFDQRVNTSGAASLAIWTGAAHTGQTATAEIIDINFALDREVQRATGAVTNQRAVLYQPPTYGFVASSTISFAATVAINGAPIQGTNGIITNSYALWAQDGINGGMCRFDGSILVGAVNINDGTDQIAVANGTAPTGDVANQFVMYSADQAAGNAAPHFRTENGQVVLLYDTGALTQTYATATATHAARTASTLTDNTGGTANTTLENLADGTTYANDHAAIENNFADLAAMVNNLITDQQNTAQFANELADRLQALGVAN